MSRFNFLSLFTYILFIIFYLSFVGKTSALLSDDLGLDLYKNIDKGIYELELKNYEFEMTNGGKTTISEKINQITGKQCIEDGISLNQIEKIVAGDLIELSNVIKKECKVNGKDLDNLTISYYQGIIVEIYNKTKLQAQEKSSTIYKVSRIGLYSDGDINNSPFDLIKDLEDINTIIFASENKYEGVESYSNGNPLNNMISGLRTDGKNFFLPYSPIKLTPYTGGLILPILPPGNIDTGVIYACPVNDSGLDDGDLEDIIGGSGTGNTNTGSISGSGKYTASGNLIPLESDYSKVNDNSFWNCDSFFCIVIEFSTYNHKLLGGGQNISIESILKKSNDHIHKFTNTSVLQKKMSVNDWELSLKNLNLQNIFNLNFIIYKKSPPILNVDKKDKQEETIDKNSPLTWENQAIEYYKNSGLDFKQANNIQNLKRKIEELKCTQDSGELTNVEAEAKCNQYRVEIKRTEEHNLKVTNSINELVKKGDLTTFHDMFVELQIFTKAFEDYINGVRSQILKMDKKPVG